MQLLRRIAIGCIVIVMLVGVHADGTALRSPSPVFGINLSMYGPAAPDPFIDNPAARRLFATLSVPLVRVPIRAGLSDQRLLAALRAVRAVGATPVIILHGAIVDPLPAGAPHETAPDNEQLDLHLLSLIREVFGSAPVYLEFGNEEDTAGIDARKYTRAWNAIVPGLRRHAPPAYRFGGPVTYNDNLRYIGYFAGRAVPRPDFISWHEYVCGVHDGSGVCTRNLARWGAHVRATNARIRVNARRRIPLMITEWNLDPDPDPRYRQPAFIGPWVRRALAELERLRGQGLAGAIYYTATTNAAALIAGGGPGLTPEGAAWAAALQRSRW